MTNEFNVVGIDHVTITTPQELEEEVLDWYGQCLRLEPAAKPEGTRARSSWFKAGDQEVHISVDPHNPPKEAHFGVVVNDFTAVVECLRDWGSHIEQASAIPGRRRCFTRDPAGNRVEVVSFEEAG